MLERNAVLLQNLQHLAAKADLGVHHVLFDVDDREFLFARNTRDLLELVEQLTAKGVEFVSQKESIDTTTPTGKFMLTIFGAVAELEREYILQRQREGIEIAKQKGKYAGRKPISHPDFDRVTKSWRRGEITAVEAMMRLNMKPSTFYRKVRQLL